MDPSTSPDRPRKRRAINACVSCRTSKVRCDGNRPCQRCERNAVPCQYHGAAKDENTLRIEKLESEIIALNDKVNNTSNRGNVAVVDSVLTPMPPPHSRDRSAGSTAVDAGLFTWNQAALWFRRYKRCCYCATIPC